MKHGSLHTHSTLLNPTGNIERHRVRKEIKEFVQNDSKKLQVELTEHNKVFRANIRKEHNKLLGMYEHNKKEQLGRWRLRTANSPFRLDQNEIHRQLMDDWKQHFRAEKKHKHIKEELKKMTGKPVFDICSDKYLRAISDPEKKLAMERRKLMKELSVVKNESQILRGMVDDSMSDCERLFPKVAMKIAHGLTSTEDSIASSSFRSQKVSAEDAARLKSEDNRVYSAAGRYDEFGRFILADELKTKAGMVSAEYAQSTGKGGVTNDFQMINSYTASKPGSVGSRVSPVGPHSRGRGHIARNDSHGHGDVDVGTRSLDSSTLPSIDGLSLTSG